MFITTSWDDGHPDDLRVADLLMQYNFPATFYIPTTNIEGRPTLSAKEISELRTNGFEIGGHGQSHRPLDLATDEECLQEICQNKSYLEDITQTQLDAFCLVRGKGGTRVTELAKEAGYTFTRTIEQSLDIVDRTRCQMHVSAQFYPHNSLTLFKGGVRSLLLGLRPLSFTRILSNLSILERIESTALYCKSLGLPLHIWGHSWEIEEQSLHGILQDSLIMLSELYPIDRRLDNSQLYKALTL